MLPPSGRQVAPITGAVVSQSLGQSIPTSDSFSHVTLPQSESNLSRGSNVTPSSCERPTENPASFESVQTCSAPAPNPRQLGRTSDCRRRLVPSPCPTHRPSFGPPNAMRLPSGDSANPSKAPVPVNNLRKVTPASLLTQSTVPSASATRR